MNKYTGKLQEKDTTTNFITNVIYYNTKKLQINLNLKVSSPETESLTEDNQMILKRSQRWMCRWSLLGAFTSCPRNPWHVQSFSLFIFSALLFEAQNLYATSEIFSSLLVSNKNSEKKLS